MKSFMVIRLCFFIIQYWTNRVRSSDIGSGLYRRVSVTFLETISHGFLTNPVTCKTKLSCAQECKKDDCVLFKFSEGKCITYSKGIGALSRIPMTETQFYGHHDYIDEQNIECPEMFKKFERKCYLFNQEKKNWSDSQEACNTHGGRLVSVLDRLTHDFIYLNTQGERYWIGSRKVNNTWIWIHENAAITDVTVRGIHISGNGVCLETVNNAWNDYRCHYTKKSVCVL